MNNSNKDEDVKGNIKTFWIKELLQYNEDLAAANSLLEEEVYPVTDFGLV